VTLTARKSPTEGFCDSFLDIVAATDVVCVFEIGIRGRLFSRQCGALSDPFFD